MGQSHWPFGFIPFLSTPQGGCSSYLHDPSNISWREEKVWGCWGLSLSNLSRFLKMSVYKPQNSLAASAEFASPSKAKGKERVPGISHKYRPYVCRAKSNWMWVRLMNSYLLKLKVVLPCFPTQFWFDFHGNILQDERRLNPLAVGSPWILLCLAETKT